MIIKLNEAHKKLDPFYYKAVKDKIAKVTGIPKGDLHEVSWRDNEEWGFKDGFVTIMVFNYDRYKQSKSVEKLEAHMNDVKQAFNNKCEIMEVPRFKTYSVLVAQDVIDEITGGQEEEPKKDTISFWATTVFDTRTTAVAYGARIKCADGWSFPGSLSRIQQRLGEKRFYYFAKGGNKSFKTYDQLVKFIKSIDPYTNIPDEQTIINSGYDERYYTA